MTSRINIYAAVLLAVTLGANAAAFEDIEMGEAGGYRYFARIIEKTGNEVIGGVYGEVVREKGGKSEVVSEFEVPYPSCYEAGVYPDGAFYYVVGDILGRGSDKRYICVFEMGGSFRALMEDVYECILEAQREYVFFGGKLYFIESFYWPGKLYRVDHKKETVTEMVSGLNLRFSSGEGSLYYEKKGSDDWMAAWTDKGATVLLCPATGEPGASGPRVLYRIDLANGEKEKMFSAEATTTLVEAGKPAGYFGAEKAIDGDLTTAWVEGASGSGIGESLTIDFGETIELENIGLMPGLSSSPEVFRGNNRVEKVSIEFSDGTKLTRSFDDKARIPIFELDDPVNARSVKITILGVYPGERWDDTCISEVVVNYW